MYYATLSYKSFLVISKCIYTAALGKILNKSTFTLYDFKLPLMFPFNFLLSDGRGLMSSAHPKAIPRIIFTASKRAHLLTSSCSSNITLGMTFQGPTRNNWTGHSDKNTDTRSYIQGRLGGLEGRALGLGIWRPSSNSSLNLSEPRFSCM